MKIKSSPNSLKHYFDAYGFSNISEADFSSEIERYKSLGKDQKTIDFISKLLLKYGNVKSRPWTFENTKYINSYTKIYFTCKKHGVVSQFPFKMLNDRLSMGCGKCGADNKKTPNKDAVKQSMLNMSRAKMEKTVEELLRKYGFSNITEDDFNKEMIHFKSLGMFDRSILLIQQRLLKFGLNDNLIFDLINFKGINNPITIICKKHGKYEQLASNFVKGYKCFKCIADNQKTSYEDVEKDYRYEYDDKWNKEHWTGISGSIIRYKCKIHGVIEQKSIIHFLLKSGCPLCSESHMENVLHKKLLSIGMNYGEDFVREKEFPDLVGDFNFPLRYDFFILNKNTLIELDGEFHYKKLNVSDKDFEKRKKYDKLKTEYANNHGIKLIRIKYDEFTEWIDGIKSVDDLI